MPTLKKDNFKILTFFYRIADTIAEELITTVEKDVFDSLENAFVRDFLLNEMKFSWNLHKN